MAWHRNKHKRVTTVVAIVALGVGGYAGSTAIGNNLTVVTQGNYNTVIVNSNQVNNGAVTAGSKVVKGGVGQ